MKFRKRQKTVRTINLVLKIVGVILFCGLVGYLLYLGINNKSIDLEGINGIVFPIVTIFLIVVLVLIFALGPIMHNSYINNIKNKCEKRKFKYLDTFYYSKYETSQGDTGHTRIYFYNVFEDVDSNKIYAIYKDASNSQLQVNLDGSSILFKGQGVRTNWQRVNYQDTGSYWIKEELPEFYKKNNDEIILNFEDKFYYNQNPKGDKIEWIKNKKPIVYNRNPDYDLSLLDQVTFIDGYMEFDTNK